MGQKTKKERGFLGVGGQKLSVGDDDDDERMWCGWSQLILA